MKKGLECHVRENEIYAKGNGETGHVVRNVVSKEKQVRLGLQKDGLDNSGKAV